MVPALLSKLQLEGFEVIQIRTAPKELTSTEAWHYDAPHTPVPPKISILSAQVVPVGGDTMWTNQYLAYESLSPVMQRMLQGLRVHFRGARLARFQGVSGAEVPQAVHPLVRTHPETGRKVLEPPRVLRRLQHLRRWSYDQVKQVLTRGPRARRAHGAGASSRLPIAVGSH
jgi:taurine dioxygenase